MTPSVLKRLLCSAADGVRLKEFGTLVEGESDALVR